MKKRYLSIKECSNYTGIAEKTLYEWAAAGRIPSIKIGRVLFDKTDIDNFMSAQKRNTEYAGKMKNKILAEIRDDGV